MGATRGGRGSWGGTETSNKRGGSNRIPRGARFRRENIVGENVSSKVVKVTPSLYTVNMTRRSNSVEGDGTQPPSHEQSIHPFSGVLSSSKTRFLEKGRKGRSRGGEFDSIKTKFLLSNPSSNPPTSSLCLDSSIMALRIPLPLRQYRG